MVEVGNKEKHIFCEEKVARNTIGVFADDGIYFGSEMKYSEPNENPRSLKPRISVEGGLQRETMDSGASLYQYTLSWIVTDFKHLQYLLSSNVEAGASPYTHTFSLALSTTSKFFSYQRILGNGTVMTYLGCSFLRVKYEWQKSTGDDESGYIRATASVIATSFDDTVAAQVAGDDTTTKVPFTFNEFKATVGGTEIVECINGSIEIDSGINPEEFFYCNATLDENIGTINPVFYTTVGNLVVNIKDGTQINEMQQDGISGVNKFEFIKDNTTNKIVFTFADLFNLQPFSDTNYRGLTSVGVVYDATIINIVVTDEIVNY